MTPETFDKGPSLRLNTFELAMVANPGGKAPDVLEVAPTFDIEGDISWAEHVRFGVVGFVKKSANESDNLSARLWSYVDKHEPDREKFADWEKQFEVAHLTRGINRIKPFEVMHVERGVNLPVRISSPGVDYLPYAWKAAMYILARGTPPSWYQLRLTLSAESHKIREFLTTESKILEIRRLWDERPVVAIEKP